MYDLFRSLNNVCLIDEWVCLLSAIHGLVLCLCVSVLESVRFFKMFFKRWPTKAAFIWPKYSKYSNIATI